MTAIIQQVISMPSLYILAGCSGSGKTRYAKQLAVSLENSVMISKDDIREALAQELHVEGIGGFVFQEHLKEIGDLRFHDALQKAAAERKNVIVDATHLIPEWRKTTLSFFGPEYEKKIVIFEAANVEVLYHNNAMREQERIKAGFGPSGITNEFILQQYQSYTSPSLKEGFDEIMIQRVREADYIGR